MKTRIRIRVPPAWVLILALAAALALGGCGPIYDLRYEYEKPPGADRLCFSQCVTGRSHCRQLARLADANRERDRALCVALASGESDDDRRAKRVAECRLNFPRLPLPATEHNGGNCQQDYNECFVACGGTVHEIRECVINCGQ